MFQGLNNEAQIPVTRGSFGFISHELPPFFFLNWSPKTQTSSVQCGLNFRRDCTLSWLCPPSPWPATFTRPQLFLLETPRRTLSQLRARIRSVVHDKFLNGCKRRWGWGEEGEYVVDLCPIVIRSPLMKPKFTG